jgi:hypothetical protein
MFSGLSSPILISLFSPLFTQKKHHWNPWDRWPYKTISYVAMSNNISDVPYGNKYINDLNTSNWEA